MLAEPRNKQKWAVDPRNTQWSQDQNKFGYQLMSKMGWSEGKGLGANESGCVSHVKVTKRKQNLGLGSTTNHSENWLAHQDDFSELLANLNQKNVEGNDKSLVEGKERSSLKSSVKQSRKKIFYSKFIHSKDLSLKSKNDLDCVMGQRSKSTPATPQDLSEDEGVKSDTSTASCPVIDGSKSQGIVTRNSEMNLQEYFAQKMAAIKKRRESSVIEGNAVENNEMSKSPTKKDEDLGNSEEKAQKKKKRKKERKDKTNDCEEIKEISADANYSEENIKSKKRKKSKKSRCDIEEIPNCSPVIVEEISNTGDGEVKKSKKKKVVKDVTNSEKLDNDIEKIKSKKKKKKRKHDEVDDISENDNSNSTCKSLKKSQKT